MPPPAVQQLRLAGAPISWGVCERREWGITLPAERVLAEMSSCGLRATELGPPGYLPSDPELLQAALDAHDLRLVAAFLPLTLHGQGSARTAIDELEEVTRTLSRLGVEAVLIAPVVDADWSRRVELTERQWRCLLGALSAAAERAAANGIVAALHPHAGSLVQEAAEIDRALVGSEIDLCLDTGHFVIGGADPAEFVRAHADRIVHVHLKDVDAELARRVGSGELAMFDAVREDLFLPLGDGDGRIAEVVRLLVDRGYEGWFVLEQDTALAAVPGPGDAGPAAEVRHSIDFLDELIPDRRGGSPIANATGRTARP